MDTFHQNSFATIKSHDSKLRTYALLKTEIGYEKYLDYIKNTKTRRTVAKFRLSNHKLKIETGRYDKNKKNDKTDPDQDIIPTERACPFCPDQVESEIHFLIRCPTYEPVRDHIFNLIEDRNPGFSLLEDTSKFQHLFQEECIEGPKLIKQCWELREHHIHPPG